MNIDLHIHTSFSDGIYSPEEIVDRAHEKGLKVIAITDHDCVEGIAPALRRAEKYDLKVIPGIEMGSDEIHFLGYFIDYRDPVLLKTLERIDNFRIERALLIIEKLGRIGLHISFEDVKKYARDGVVGRLHIARAVVNKGYARDSDEVFNKYINSRKPAYVPLNVLKPEEVIESIKSAGGVPVIAHPVYTDERLIRRAIDAGAAGIEIFHGMIDINSVNRFMKMARSRDLVVTGGTDYHGNGYYLDMGQTPVPSYVVEDLCRKARRKDCHNENY